MGSIDRSVFDKIQVRHGSAACYNRGCRRQECKDAHNRALKRYRNKRRKREEIAEMIRQERARIGSEPVSVPARPVKTARREPEPARAEMPEDLPFDFRDLLAEVESSGIFKSAPAQPVTAGPVAQARGRKPGKSARACQHCGAQPGLGCEKLISVTGGSLGSRVYQLCERCGNSEILAGASRVA